jgi:hypothetical protein
MRSASGAISRLQAEEVFKMPAGVFNSLHLEDLLSH